MALFYELPVYKSSYDLLMEIFELVKHFPREYKYTVGEKLKDEALEMIMNIYRANTRQQKKDTLQNAREHLEVVRLLMRLTKDMKQININRFVDVNKKIEDISKQLTGWQKASPS
jgi:four helix bundle protein